MISPTGYAPFWQDAAIALKQKQQQYFWAAQRPLTLQDWGKQIQRDVILEAIMRRSPLWFWECP